MSRVNQVKKILRDRGVEMDVDDVLHVLRADPRFRTGLTRDQVANSLSGLHATDPDVIRTRRGLYRYVDTAPARTVTTPPNPERWTPTRAQSTTPLEPDPAMWLVVELPYLRAQVAGRLDTSPIDDATLVDHAVRLAELQLGGRPQVVTCATARAVAAAVVAALAGPAPIMLIGSETTANTAAILAGHVDRTIAVLTLPSARTTPILAAQPPAPVAPPTPISRQTAQGEGSLVGLSELDHPGFHRPLHPAGKGSRRDLHRQARCIGAGYAARWWSVVTDDDHDQLIVWAARHPDLPDELHLDLLLFAEHHKLPSPDELDHELCCGFWTAVRERRPLFAADHTNASTAAHPIAS